MQGSGSRRLLPLRVGAKGRENLTMEQLVSSQDFSLGREMHSEVCIRYTDSTLYGFAAPDFCKR